MKTYCAAAGRSMEVCQKFSKCQIREVSERERSDGR